MWRAQGASTALSSELQAATVGRGTMSVLLAGRGPREGRGSQGCGACGWAGLAGSSGRRTVLEQGVDRSPAACNVDLLVQQQCGAEALLAPRPAAPGKVHVRGEPCPGVAPVPRQLPGFVFQAILLPVPTAHPPAAPQRGH